MRDGGVSMGSFALWCVSDLQQGIACDAKHIWGLSHGCAVPATVLFASSSDPTAETSSRYGRLFGYKGRASSLKPCTHPAATVTGGDRAPSRALGLGIAASSRAGFASPKPPYLKLELTAHSRQAMPGGRPSTNRIQSSSRTAGR